MRSGIVLVFGVAYLLLTGQRLIASAATQAIYATIIVAALAQTYAALESAYYGPLLYLAAFAWTAAFLGFSITFGRLLTSQR